MKKFRNNFLIFISIPLLCLLLIEIAISAKRDMFFREDILEKNYGQIANEYLWIKQINKNSKILLAGSSTVRYGLNCNQLNSLSNDSLNFINIAYDARDPIETYFILKQSDLKGVKSLYFALDPWIFSKAYYRFRNQFLFLDFNFCEALKYSAEYNNTILKRRYIRIGKLILNINTHHSNCIYEIPNNFGSSMLDIKPQNFDQPIDEMFEIEKYGWSQLQFDYFNKIILLCKKKDIDFFAFVTPKRYDFCETYKNKCSNIQTQFVAKLMNSSTKFKIIGRFDDLKSYNSDSTFIDFCHLSSFGQMKYTTVFYNSTIKMNNSVEFTNEYSWFNN